MKEARFNANAVNCSPRKECPVGGDNKSEIATEGAQWRLHVLSANGPALAHSPDCCGPVHKRAPRNRLRPPARRRRTPPPKTPWRPPQRYSPISPDIYTFFNANFSYLDKPDAEWQSPSDAFKRVRIGDELFMVAFGGEERIRQMNEVNSRLSGKDNNYQLLRSRVYGDLWFEDKVRVYVEYYDAQSFSQDLPPARIDINKSDFLNAFI